VLSATRNVTALREALGRHGTVVAYKGGRRLRELREGSFHRPKWISVAPRRLPVT
jgi:hypothetical protein